MKKLSLAVAFILVLGALPASAQLADWSQVGSTGAIDDASLGLYDAIGADLRFRGNLLGTITSRYHVTNTFGSAVSFIPPWQFMLMAYVDNGANAAVRARLFRIKICDNQPVLICEIRSDDGGLPTQCKRCQLTERLDFNNYTYYIEVDLNRTAIAGTPVLNHLSLF